MSSKSKKEEKSKKEKEKEKEKKEEEKKEEEKDEKEEEDFEIFLDEILKEEGGGEGGDHHIGRQESYSNAIGPGATIKDNVFQNRIKCTTIVFPEKQKYEIVIPEGKIPEIIQKAQEMSPLFVTNIATKIEEQMAIRSPRIYTWLLIAEIKDSSYDLKLLVNEVMSRQEIGTAHIDMFYRYETQTGRIPDRVYLSGEFQTDITRSEKSEIKFNLSSGTFMLEKFFKLTKNEKPLNIDEAPVPSWEEVIEYFQTEILPLFFPPAKFAITYSDKTFIQSTQAITPEEWKYLQELFENNPGFLVKTGRPKSKTKKGGFKSKTKKGGFKSKKTIKKKRIG